MRRRRVISGLAGVVAVACLGLGSARGADLGGRPMPGPGSALPAVAGFALPACSGDPAKIGRIDFKIGGTPTYAVFALPAGPARGIVVYGHGYNEWAAESYDERQLEGFASVGAIAVAPDFRGTVDPPDLANPDLSSRGAPMAAGSQDMAALAEAVLAQCPAKVVIASGGSTGGGIAGLAVTLAAKRPGGAPLFDDWIGLSPLTDVFPIWAGAHALALFFTSAGISSAGQYYSDAASDFEAEMGGTPATAGGAYLSRSMITRAADLRAAGLKGVVILHAAADLDITAEQPTVMISALKAAGVPVQVDLATTPSPGEQDSSIDNFVIGGPLSLFGVRYHQILAGHQSPILRDAAVRDVGRLLDGESVHDGQVILAP